MAETQPLWGDPRRDGDRCEIELQIPAGLLYLQGHFPETPIVPGVALTDWAVQQAAAFAEREPRVAGLARLKFHQVLQPGDRAILSLQPSAAGAAMEFQYRDGERLFASGRILWRTQPA